jgi:small subunit ribosomal protein S6
LRRYEVVYVAFDDLSQEEADAQLERYLSIISGYKGTVVKVDKWGKRKLAYPIQKRREGCYVLIDFVGDSAIVPEMERRFRIDDKILRYISVKKADKVDLEEIEREIAAIREAAKPAEKEAVEEPSEAAETGDIEESEQEHQETKPAESPEAPVEEDASSKEVES